MAIALVNTDAASDYSGTSSATLNSAGQNHTAGNLIVVGLSIYNPTNVYSVGTITDTAGNNYVPVDTEFDATNTTTTAIYYSKNIIGNASNVISINISGGSVQYWGFCVLQYSGSDTASPYDQTAYGEAVATTTVTSGTFTTTASNEVLVSVSRSDSTIPTWTAGSGYTIEKLDPAGGGVMMQDKIVSAIQTSVTASATVDSSRNFVIMVATFKATAAAAGTPFFMQLGAQRI